MLTVPRVPTLVLAALLLLPSVASAAVPPAKPNIVVILADDHGRADYSAYGTKDLRTPHIDRIFREGMTFDNFYANSCVCSPTRAALLTGRYPDRVGVPGVIRYMPEDSWGYLSPEAVMLPQVLKKAGYHTALVGKWHLGLESPNAPNERGFDHFHGFLGDMMDDYWTHLRHGRNFMRRNAEVIEPEGHATDLFTDWACDYLAERAGADQPFFLYLAYNAPHGPIQPPEASLKKVMDREPQASATRQQLVALIEHMDDGIGRVLATLDRLNVSDNTIVVFTSDNGGLLAEGANNGTWRSGKTHMYEGGLRVPAAVRWPLVIAAGERTDRVALTMDIFATCCEAAGAAMPEECDAKSFLPTLLAHGQDPSERDLYFCRREGGANYGGKTIEALIRGPWKLVQDSPFAPLELYNLQDDPQEATNLAQKEKGIFRDLSAALRKQIQVGGRTAWQREQRLEQGH